MKSGIEQQLLLTGLGVSSAVGQGKQAFMRGLINGSHNFSIMEREGRQCEDDFIGAEMLNFACDDILEASVLRTASLSAQVALTTLHESWNDAELGNITDEKIGLVIGGSNVQQRELILTHEKYRNKPMFLPPSYSINFLDTDLCGLCTAAFDIHGMAFTVGGASASGQLAIIEAAEAVISGRVDICIAIGALMDLSYWECRGFRSLGAMGSDLYGNKPGLACRPFDKNRDGFIYGEGCAAVVIERAETFQSRSDKRPYATLKSWAMHMDANRNPDPSLSGEIEVIRRVMAKSNLTASEIDYVNPHGSGSVVGDEIELKALKACSLEHAFINTTKSITGHCLTAAGTLEVAATVLQMREGVLHPSRNLKEPADRSFSWVKQDAVCAELKNCISLSYGFGGVNTAVCLSKYD